MELKNFAHFFCTAAIVRLIELGVDHFFIAPGSRSTPIVSAIVRHPEAKIYLGVDERCVGFSALGYGKRANKAAVVVVTSGTAASNLYPAITEAYLSSVPMLVLTADRPFELRDCGANQTIFQPMMFADHTVKSFDLAPPSPLVSLDATVAIIEQGLRYAQGARKGPVHINMQLREPVSNLAHEHEPHWSQKTKLAPRSLPTTTVLAHQPSAALVDKFTGKGLIVVGELLPHHGQDEIAALAARLGWPIFADISSNLRLRRHANVIAHFDVKMLNPDFLASLDACTTVVKFGSRIVSKRLWQWLEHRPPTTTMMSFDESMDRIDQTGRFSHACIGHLPTFVRGLLDEAKDNSWALATTASVDNEIAAMLERAPNNEAYFAARLVARINAANLFLSSGMPIRDVDQFASPTSAAIDVFVNRGASGIDGIMSTAAGIAIGHHRPTYVLMGDVAFLHDTNGLMQIKQSKTPLCVVVINNGGGGIFHFLPIAHELDVVTPYLDTPHHVRIESLCHAHDVPHVVVSDARGFDDALAAFKERSVTTVIEVTIDKTVNVKLHQDFYQKIAGRWLS